MTHFTLGLESADSSICFGSNLAHLWHFPLERVAPFPAGSLSQLQNFRLSRQSLPVETTLNQSHRVRTFPACCLLPMNSIKCLQASYLHWIMLFNVERYTTSVPFECRSFMIAIKLRITFTTPLDAITKTNEGQRSLVHGTTPSLAPFANNIS